jgi:hypothetical protein
MASMGRTNGIPKAASNKMEMRRRNDLSKHFAGIVYKD